MWACLALPAANPRSSKNQHVSFHLVLWAAGSWHRGMSIAQRCTPRLSSQLPLLDLQQPAARVNDNARTTLANCCVCNGPVCATATLLPRTANVRPFLISCRQSRDTLPLRHCRAPEHRPALASRNASVDGNISMLRGFRSVGSPGVSGASCWPALRGRQSQVGPDLDCPLPRPAGLPSSVSFFSLFTVLVSRRPIVYGQRCITPLLAVSGAHQEQAKHSASSGWQSQH